MMEPLLTIASCLSIQSPYTARAHRDLEAQVSLVISQLINAAQVQHVFNEDKLRLFTILALS